MTQGEVYLTCFLYSHTTNCHQNLSSNFGWEIWRNM